ncbi:MAG: hypothetical protein ACYC8V_02145 [Caulobacteraceae bacterium]
MPARHLAIVAPPSPTEIDRPAERLSDRIHRLQAEARNLAQGHIVLLCAALAEVSRLAEEVADGGDAYPVGARELCRRLTEDVTFQSRTLSVIAGRHGD